MTPAAWNCVQSCCRVETLIKKLVFWRLDVRLRPKTFRREID